MSQTIFGSLCWILDGERVLMLKRRKFPHEGLWVALGGKIEQDESPFGCAIREVNEESGLVIEHPQLRGIVSVIHKAVSQHWILFIYVASDPKGTLSETSEEELAWIPLSEVANLPMAKTDRLYLTKSLDSGSVFQASVIYDDDSLFEVALL